MYIEASIRPPRSASMYRSSGKMYRQVVRMYSAEEKLYKGIPLPQGRETEMYIRDVRMYR
jgi:hypothetical protein